MRRSSASSRDRVSSAVLPQLWSASITCDRTCASLRAKAMRRYASVRSPQRCERARAAAMRTASSGSRKSGARASGASSRRERAIAAAASIRTACALSRAAFTSASQEASSFPSRARTAVARSFATGEATLCSA